jgi:hypothetical protein
MVDAGAYKFNIAGNSSWAVQAGFKDTAGAGVFPPKPLTELTAN